MGGPGGGRAEGGSGLVEELILEPLGHMGDGRFLRLAEVGAGVVKGQNLAPADRVDVLPKLL